MSVDGDASLNSGLIVAGPVGIGMVDISSNSAILHVKGDVYIEEGILNIRSGHEKQGMIYNSSSGGGDLTLSAYSESSSLDMGVSFLTAGGMTRMRVAKDGNVGIGTDNPLSLLDVNGAMRAAYDTNTPSYFGRSAIGGNSNYNDYAYFSHLHMTNLAQYAIMQQNNGATYVNAADGQSIFMRINNSNKMRVTPDGVYFDSNVHSYINNVTGGIRIFTTYRTHNNTFITMMRTDTRGWRFWLGSSNNFELMYYDGSWTMKLYVVDERGGQGANFTGQHRCFIENVPFRESEKYIGLIVSANKDDYIGVTDKLYRGKRAITINDALPETSLSQKEKDKSCFGVISDSEDESNNRTTAWGSLRTASHKQTGDVRYFINSVGEGAIWVSNKNGDLESGDYITTSSIPGYGQKQDSDSLKNYTVAKITMSCDFNPGLQYVKRIKRRNVDFVYDTSGNCFDSSGNKLFIIEEDSTRTITNKTLNYNYDEFDMLTSITENILDEHGEIQWEDTEEQERKYNIRHMDPSGNIITEEEYTGKKAASEEAYIAAFVGCTYHCG